MTPNAFTHDDKPVYARQFSSAEWEALKALSSEQPFAYKMGCCGSRAVLKTSINGLQFFAHYSDECATAPETNWHIAGKDMVLQALNLFGVKPRTEVPGSIGREKWRADVYFEVGDRKIAIELQRSYQHLNDFLKRQDRYKRSGVECYWLVRQEVATPLFKLILRKRFIEEFNRVMPPESFIVNLPDFFFAVLKPDEEQSINAPRMATSHYDLLAAIVNNALSYDGRVWQIHYET